MKDFRSLKVWESAYQLSLDVYRVSVAFPADERFGLTSQLRRSVVSIPSNIAEGCGRGTDSDFTRFVQIAMGSASEVECQLMLARDLGFVPAEASDPLIANVQEIKRMISGLIKRLNADR